ASHGIAALLLVARHHEAVAHRAAGLRITSDDEVFDRDVRTEDIAEILFGGLEVDVADEDFKHRRHWEAPLRRVHCSPDVDDPIRSCNRTPTSKCNKKSVYAKQVPVLLRILPRPIRRDD